MPGPGVVRFLPVRRVTALVVTGSLLVDGATGRPTRVDAGTGPGEILDR